jgi:hypothetical protein
MVSENGCVRTSKIVAQPTPVLLLLSVIFIVAVGSASAQLSQNSGINPYDTYAVFDLTIRGRGVINLPQPIYNPLTQSTSSTLDLTLEAQYCHVEVGYDLNLNPA